MLINDASITGSLIVNASASFQNISVGGNIIPDETNLRNLGSTDKFFKEIYVSTGSINFVDNGEVVAILSAGTINAIQSNTSSANDRLDAIENFTSSLNTTYTTDAELNASSSALTSNINTKLNSSSFNSFTASISATNTFTSSATARLNSIEATTASFTTIVAGINIKTGSYATTGSNSFNGNQTITGSLIVSSVATISSSYVGNNSSMTLNSGSNLYVQNNGVVEITGSTRISGSLTLIGTTNLVTTGSNTFVGTQTITGSLYISSDLIVQGSSSLQNITASAVSIGTNLINLNTANPAIRYAGLSIGDSGSIGSSGSFLYDSVQDEFIFVHRGANTTVTSSVVLMGPQTFDSIGNETYLTSNRIPKGAGNEHLADSNISDTGTLVTINSVTSSFSGLVGIGTTSPANRLEVFDTQTTTPQFQIKETSSAYHRFGILKSGSFVHFVEPGNDGTSASEYLMTINMNGNSVGIGTTNPINKLNVLVDGVGNEDGITLGIGSQGDGIKIVQRYLSNRVVATLGQSNYSGATDSAALRLYDVGGTETIRLSAKTNIASFINSGNVGIGTTGPEQKLHIDGNVLLGAGTSNDFGQRYLQIRGSRGSAGQSAATLFLSQIWNGVSYPAIIEAQQGKVYGNAAADLVFKTSYFSGGVNTIERMRITDGGLIGIGTTSPNSMIHIDGGGTRALRLDVNSGIQAMSISPNGIFGIDEPGVGNGRFIINTNGRVGIGITNPSYKLDVSGDFYTSGNQSNNGGYYYSQGSTVLRKTLNITEGVTTTLLSFDQAGSYGHTGGGEILVVFVDPGSPWGVYVWKGLLTIRTVTFTGAYYGSNLSTISSNATLDGSFSIDATFTKSYASANGEVRVRAIPGSGIGGTAYVYWNGLITQGGNAY